MSFKINDAIHRYIFLNPEEQKIIDHPYFQRLRYISQLGFVSLVYPSATHDRFSHSLGTLHIASMLADQILYNEEVSAVARSLSEDEKKYLKRIIRLSSLLHDIGHAPFSHTAEALTPSLPSLDLPQTWYKDPKEDRKATHEDYGVLLVAGLSQGRDPILTPEDSKTISSLFHHKKILIPDEWKKRFANLDAENLHLVIRSIISSNIDADRMDYLLRDAHFVGVTYGSFDLPWLVSNLGTATYEGKFLMSISENGVHALEHYLFARYHMYVQVYMHKTVKSFEYYFQQAINQKETSYKIPKERDQYLLLRDSTLLEALFTAASRNRTSWSARLVHRLPAKRVARVWDDRKNAEKKFKRLKDVLSRIGVTAFHSYSELKFLDIPEPSAYSPKGMQGKLLVGLASLPLVVARKRLGEISTMPVADRASILKRYHEDTGFGDIYILPEEFDRKEKEILATLRNHIQDTAAM